MKALLTVLVLLHSAGVLVGWLMSLGDIEQILYLGPILSGSGIVICLLALLSRSWTCFALGLGLPVFSIACFLLIYGLTWSPSDAYVPINSLIAAYAVIHAPFCCWAFLESSDVEMPRNSTGAFQFSISGIMVLTAIVAVSLGSYRAMGFQGIAVAMLIWYGLVGYAFGRRLVDTGAIKHILVTSKAARESEQEERACELLDAFVPDLATEKKFAAFRQNLFALDKGVWLSVRKLCQGHSECVQFFELLDPLTDSELFVVWLDHPGDSDYAYVHFYLDAFFWRNSAICRLSPEEGQATRVANVRGRAE